MHPNDLIDIPDGPDGEVFLWCCRGIVTYTDADGESTTTSLTMMAFWPPAGHRNSRKIHAWFRMIADKFG